TVSESTQPRSPEPVATAPGGAYGGGSSVAADTTPSGYRKRVRGKHAPRTEVIAARGGQDAPTASADAEESTADRMRSMLSGLQAGTERAKAEVQSSDDPTDGGR